MSELTVTTIIPTYDRADLLPRALDSAIENSRESDEIIVIDDGSTDNTREVLQPYLSRIRYIHQENRGAGAARNHAIAEATGDLIALLDSDDAWIPGKLELQRRLFQSQQQILYSFTDFTSRLADGTLVRKALQQWVKDKRPWSEIFDSRARYSDLARLPEGSEDFDVYIGDINKYAVRSGFVNTDTLVARRKEAGDALQFFEDVPLYEEQLCYARLAAKGLAAFLDIELVRHFSHPGPRLTDADALVEASTRIEISQRIWGSDPDYIAKYGDLYRQVVNENRQKRAAALISLGRTAEARKEHRKMQSVPLSHRLIGLLPGPLAKAIVAVRRSIRLGGISS